MRHLAPLLIALVLLTTGCQSTTPALTAPTAPSTVTTMSSPLVGTWTNAHADPSQDFTGTWVKLTFTPGHQLHAYFTAGTRLAQNPDEYTIEDAHTVAITEQSDVERYAYSVSGDHLTLVMEPTPSQQQLYGRALPQQTFIRVH